MAITVAGVRNQRTKYLRRMLKVIVVNNIMFCFVINDALFVSSEKMNYIHSDIERDFVMPLKSNRKAAFSLSEN